jgi:hypothetical protein
MPHLEKGKRHFCKGVKKATCVICGKKFECPTNKKVPVCYDYRCNDERDRRKKQREKQQRAKKLKEKKNVRNKDNSGNREQAKTKKRGSKQPIRGDHKNPGNV